MRVLISGSRDYERITEIGKRLARLEADDTELIVGDACGVDMCAQLYASSLGIPFREFRADWKAHGKRAGILRNLAMLDEEPDLVLAFWNGESRGTKHVIDEANRRGLALEVI